MKSKIEFDTKPKNAEIVINDTVLGKSPIDIEDVNPGVYSYSVYLNEENLKNSGMLTVYSGKTTHISIDLSSGEKIEEYFNTFQKQESFIPLSLQEQPSEKDRSIPESSKQTTSTSITETPKKEEQPSSGTQEIINALAIISKKLDVQNSISSRIQSINNNTMQIIKKDKGFDENRTLFNTGQTAITVSTPNQPASFDTIANSVTGTPGYDRVRVAEMIHRKSPKLRFSNIGNTNLYVIISHDGRSFSGSEIIVLRGATQVFDNVYELRVRGPAAGNLDTTVGKQPGGIYQVTEYDSSYNNYNLNKPALFITTAVNIPVKGIGFQQFTITGDIINLKSFFRSSVENTDIVYYTYQGGDTTFTIPVSGTAKVGALAPGDVLRVDGTRGLIVYFASKSASGQNIELVTMTDLTT